MIRAGVALGVIIAAFTLGWNVKGWRVDAAHKRAMDAAQAQFVIDLAAFETDREVEAEARRQLSAELEAARANVRTITREIIREVPARVQDSDEKCDRAISPDLAMLYNRSIGLRYGDSSADTGSPEGQDSAAGRGPE